MQHVPLDQMHSIGARHQIEPRVPFGQQRDQPLEPGQGLGRQRRQPLRHVGHP